MSKEQILNIIRKEKPYLSEKYHLSEIGLFGSFSRGEEKPESDVDVLVKFLPGGIPGLFEYINLAHYLEDKFGRKVDLLTPESIRPAFKEYILPTVIYV